MVISVVLVTFVSLTFVGAAMLMQMQIGTMRDYWADRAQVAVLHVLRRSRTEDTCTGGAATRRADRRGAGGARESDARAAHPRRALREPRRGVRRTSSTCSARTTPSVITPDQLNETFWVNLVDQTQSDVLIEAFSGTAGRRGGRGPAAVPRAALLGADRRHYIAVGIAALMLIAAVLLIATTIRLSAYARRKEIGIMRLVGASNRFIQTPFILEGVFAALLGSLLASAAVVAGVHFGVDGYLRAARRRSSPRGSDLADAWLVIPVLILHRRRARRAVGGLRHPALAARVDRRPVGPSRCRLMGCRAPARCEDPSAQHAIRRAVMPRERGEKVVATNRRARHDYTIEKTYEAGLVLTRHRGEVAAPGAREPLRRLRLHRGRRGVARRRAHPRVLAGALDEPRHRSAPASCCCTRTRSSSSAHAVSAGGYTLVPLKLYFSDGRAKVEIAVAKGKHEYDKRQTLRERQDKREAERAMRSRNRSATDPRGEWMPRHPSTCVSGCRGIRRVHRTSDRIARSIGLGSCACRPEYRRHSPKLARRSADATPATTHLVAVAAGDRR